MIMNKKPIILIDAYSQIFRAFYAIRRLTNKRGEPVNAAFVFTKLLLKLEKLYPDTDGAMLFDCGKVEFRLKLAPEYKANRPPMPDDLKAQMPLLQQIADAFGWQQLQHTGFEADDLIGGIAKSCDQENILILSSDKDLSQLIDDRVSMLVPQNGSGGGFEERGVDEVIEKFGVAPGLIVDYLALLGDSSDNIAGVPGIGPKGAAELLNTFGAAELWLKDPEIISSSKFAKKLDGQYDLLRRNRELVRLKTELPSEFGDIRKALNRRQPDWQKIREICLDNQFNSVLKDLPESAETVPAVKEAVPQDAAADTDDLFSFAEKAAAAAAPAPISETDKDKDIPEQLELF